ncbi:mitochondrial 54S ribosomal protein mL49 IMG2 [Sporobolomyces salmoneus]|uniref:mitochondrial 54S ribosomal protein mL49 IMG2 n=1 Tax=Sporobolomyces salmoneus TaxID=183962 RepID=UPI0031812497
MQRTLTLLRSPLLRSPFLPRSFSTTPSSLSSIPPSPAPSTSEQTTPRFTTGSATSTLGEEDSKYFVPRSQFGELPVYSDVRNNGTRVLTVIRKVHGDVSELHKDLSQFLDRSTVSYTKPQTQQIVIKGDWVREVKEWLAHRGF